MLCELNLIVHIMFFVSLPLYSPYLLSKVNYHLWHVTFHNNGVNWFYNGRYVRPDIFSYLLLFILETT